MPKPLTGRRRQARELRDACMLLAARQGFAAQRDGAHLSGGALAGAAQAW